MIIIFYVLLCKNKMMQFKFRIPSPLPIIRKYTTDIKEKSLIKVDEHVIINKNYISSIVKSDSLFNPSNPHYKITLHRGDTCTIYLFDEKDNSNPYYAKVEEFVNKNSE